jgi:hypothetical protein
VLETLLGSPPPPPPPDVPSLPDRGESGKPTSVRDRLEAHRKNAACAVCHAPMDPLGFALENFDAIGAWRTTDGGATIDASGMMPGGPAFTGPSELRAFLVSRQRLFVDTAAAGLLTYALGRSVEYYDMPSVRAIVASAAPDDYRWSSLILAIVNSPPFRMRKALSQNLESASGSVVSIVPDAAVDPRSK